jgi:hypothetical protein
MHFAVSVDSELAGEKNLTVGLLPTVNGFVSYRSRRCASPLSRNKTFPIKPMCIDIPPVPT